MGKSIDFISIFLMCFMCVFQIFGMVTNIVHKEKMGWVLLNIFFATVFMFLAFLNAVG